MMTLREAKAAVETSRVAPWLPLLALTVLIFVAAWGGGSALAQAVTTAAADAVADSATAIAFINQLPQIIMQLATLVGVVITGLIGWYTAAKAGKSVENQEKASEKRATMDSKLDVIHVTTNSLSEAAQEAALQKGIGLGIERERVRAVAEESALARGKLLAEHTRPARKTDTTLAAEAARELRESAAKTAAELLALAARVAAADKLAGHDEAADKQVAAAKQQDEAADKQLEAAAQKPMDAEELERAAAKKP